MNDSDSQIINPLSNSNVSNDVQKVLIRQDVESDCELECSQNPMLTDDEKSVVIHKFIENSQKSNSRVQNSLQLQSSNCYRIQVSSVQSSKQNDVQNPMYSGDEEGHQLKDRITMLEAKVSEYFQELKTIKDELCATNESLKHLQNDNQIIQTENQHLKSMIQTQEKQIKNLYFLFRVDEQEKTQKYLLYPNKRSKTSTEFSKEVNGSVIQAKGQNNSYLTDKSVSPLSYQFNECIANAQKHKPTASHLPIYGQQQLAALLKINISQSQQKQKFRTQESPEYHKLQKSNTQHLNQVKGQGMPSAFSFINSILKY